MAQTVKNPPAMQETWVRFLSWEEPLENRMATHSSILTCLENPQGQRCLVGYSAWGCKELDTTATKHSTAALHLEHGILTSGPPGKSQTIVFLCLLSISQALGKIELKGQKNCQICRFNLPLICHFMSLQVSGRSPKQHVSSPKPAGWASGRLPPQGTEASFASRLPPQGPAPSGCLSLPDSSWPLPIHGMFHDSPVATSECIFVIPPANI